MKYSFFTSILIFCACHTTQAQSEIHLSDYPKDETTDISDYERIIQAAKDADAAHKTLVMSGYLKVHRPLIFDESLLSGEKLTRSIRGTGRSSIYEQENTAKRAENGFCKITAITSDSYEWGTQDAVVGIVESQTEIRFNMEKITVDANNIAAYGFLIQYITKGTFRDLQAANAKRGGILIEGCQTSHFDHITSIFNKGFGMLIIGSNAAHFNHVTVTSNEGDGLVVTADTSVYRIPLINNKKRDNVSGGLWIYGLHSENNGYQQGQSSPQRGHGLALYKISGGVHIDGGWLESNAGDAIYLEDCRNASISNLRILVPNSTPTAYVPRWIRIQGTKNWGNLIENNHMESENGVKELGIVALDTSIWNIRYAKKRACKYLLNNLKT